MILTRIWVILAVTILRSRTKIIILDWQRQSRRVKAARWGFETEEFTTRNDFNGVFRYFIAGIANLIKQVSYI